MYSYNYNKLIGILKASSEDNTDMSQKVDNINSRVSRLEQRMNHLSKLILE